MKMFGRKEFLLLLGTTITAYASEYSKEPVRISIPSFTVSLSPTSREITDDEKSLIWHMVDDIFATSIPDKLEDTGFTFEFMRLASVGGGGRRQRRRRKLDWSQVRLQSKIDEITGVTELYFPGAIAGFRSTNSDNQLTAADMNDLTKAALEEELPDHMTSEMTGFSDVRTAEYRSSTDFSRVVVTDLAFPGFTTAAPVPVTTTTVQEVGRQPDGTTLGTIGNSDSLTIGAAIGGIALVCLAGFMFVFLVRRRRNSRVGIDRNKSIYSLEDEMVREVIGTNQELGQSQDHTHQEDSSIESEHRMNRYLSMMHVIRSFSFDKGRRPASVKKDMMQAPWSSGKTGGMVGTTTDDVYPSQVLISDSVLQPSYFLSNEEGTYSYSRDSSSADWTPDNEKFNNDQAWDPDDAEISQQSEEFEPPFLTELKERESKESELKPPSQVRKSRFFS
mmetsp:Transcript_17941/g.26554  ORF Transcript_17941/g.26554 Transcript_17941/m.26554 type:complete len:447 (+) Transcript_17941:79-1419(+)